MSESARLTTALADRYRLERELGAGGMATVYLAEDLKHDRKVAVKVLRPELAAVLGAERFVQEIKTTANLQHPHILPLFDSGEAEGFLYYVMPYIEGETLRDKLNRETQLRIEEAVKITTEVADALDYAHRNNVIHRDIKPENILLHDGRPMVADFGIALAVSAAAGGRMTETGLSLGTPHYMSPEQATAEKDLTNRSDIYSLGSMLYEMLTGEPPHTGATAQAIVMKIVTDDARPVNELRKLVPPHIAAATAKALEKLPADRFDTASRFAKALNDPAFVTATRQVATEMGSSWKQRVAVPALVSATVFFATTLWGWFGASRGGPALATYDVGLPDSAPLLMELGTNMAISSNAHFVVYVAADRTRQLWYRSLRDGTVRALPGTDSVSMNVAISPDDQRIAFVSGGLLKVMPIAGGTPTNVAEVFEPLGLRWISETEVFFSNADGQSIRWIDVDTGVERIHRTDRCVIPHLLPNGEQVLCGGGATQYASVIDLPTDSLLFPSDRSLAEGNAADLLRGADFRLIDGRYLTYMSVAGDLRGVAFDPSTLEFGRSITLVPGVRRGAYTGAGQCVISANGTLLFAEGPNGDIGQIVSVTRSGAPTPLSDVSAFFLRFDLAPDGRQVAVVIEGIRDQELHVYDLETGQDRIWFRGPYIGEPLWTPSGDQLMVSTYEPRARQWAIVAGPPDASSAPDTLLSGPGNIADLLTHHPNGVAVGNTWDDPAAAISIDLSTEPLTLDTIAANAFFATLSPDTRWLSYMRSQTGEQVVSPYPSLDRQYQVSNAHGEGQWLSPTELIMWQCCTTFFKATINPTAANPVVSLEEWYHDSRFSDTPGQSFTLTPDRRLIYVQAPERKPASYLRVIPNWVEQMKRAVDEANR
jgi:serine/threonine-protein kinase